MSWFIRRSSLSSEQVDELEEGSEGSEYGNDQDEGNKDLEKKLEKLTWKMNYFLIFAGIVELVMVVRSVVMT